MAENENIGLAAETITEAKISEIENSLLQGIFGCRSVEAVEASVTFASFLSTVGITPENCPLFLKMLEIENHWVIDALIANRDPFLLLSAVQPNKYIVARIFAMVTKWHKGGIYPKNLSVILGVLQSVYSSPKDGYRIYPITIANLNALGKHLDKEKSQDDPLNRVILEILDKISELEETADSEMEEIAIHSAAIRNAFFDNKKKMEDIIPPVLLVTLDNRVEIQPRNRKKLAESDRGLKKSAKKASDTVLKSKTRKPKTVTSIPKKST